MLMVDNGGEGTAAGPEEADRGVQEKGKPVGDNGEAGELKNQLQRLQAEFENYRKRTDQGMRHARNVGKTELAREMLPFFDEFAIAVSHSQDEGIKALNGNLVKTLGAQGIRKMECLGKAYDSSLHEVVRAEDCGEKEGTIIKVITDGYTCNGEVIRHAFVVISKGGSETSVENLGQKA